MVLLLVVTITIFIILVLVIIFVDADTGLQEFIYVMAAMVGGGLITLIGSLVAKLKEREPVSVKELEFLRDRVERMV